MRGKKKRLEAKIEKNQEGERYSGPGEKADAVKIYQGGGRLRVQRRDAFRGKDRLERNNRWGGRDWV